MIRTGALAERGDSRGGAEAEVQADGAGGVEPYEPEQPIQANTREQIGDLRWLACGRHRARLGDEYRVASQRAHGSDGWPEQGCELPGRLEVVAVDPYPGHVRAARPPPGRAGDPAVLRVVDDVDSPQPRHVPGS